MSTIGFVYMLRNDAMPDIVKIGCTERSPSERAAELSKPTSVPLPFEVVCYVELPDFQAVERDFHKWMGEYRVNESREFFYINRVRRGWLAGLFKYHPKALSYCDVHVEYDFVDYDEEIVNPWEKAVAPPPAVQQDEVPPEGQAANA